MIEARRDTLGNDMTEQAKEWSQPYSGQNGSFSKYVSRRSFNAIRNFRETCYPTCSSKRYSNEESAAATPVIDYMIILLYAGVDTAPARVKELGRVPGSAFRPPLARSAVKCIVLKKKSETYQAKQFPCFALFWIASILALLGQEGLAQPSCAVRVLPLRDHTVTTWQSIFLTSIPSPHPSSFLSQGHPPNVGLFSFFHSENSFSYI